MEPTKTDNLETRITKLERKGTVSLWLQFFIFPLILAGMGYFFQNAVKESEKRMEQLKITQSIVNQVFTDTIYGRTLAIRNVLGEVLENDDLSKKIDILIEEHLKDRALNGSEQDLISVTNAISNLGSNNDVLVSKINESPKIQEKLNRYQQAKELEREAFILLSNGELMEAERAFRKVEEIYPTFHQAYEISRYLKKTRTSGNTVPVPEIQNHVAEKLNWGAPPELLKPLSNRSNEFQNLP